MGGRSSRTWPGPPVSVTLVLDSGGLTMLVGNRARLEELRRRGEWPALVPSVVLTEALTGDHCRDFHQDRLLRTCDIRSIDEWLSRKGAALRTAVGATRPPSAVDAVVVALADDLGGATVLTSDVRDMRALASHALNEVRIGGG